MRETLQRLPTSLYSEIGLGHRLELRNPTCHTYTVPWWRGTTSFDVCIPSLGTPMWITSSRDIVTTTSFRWLFWLCVRAKRLPRWTGVLLVFITWMMAFFAEVVAAMMPFLGGPFAWGRASFFHIIRADRPRRYCNDLVAVRKTWHSCEKKCINGERSCRPSETIRGNW